MALGKKKRDFILEQMKLILTANDIFYPVGGKDPLLTYFAMPLPDKDDPAKRPVLESICRGIYKALTVNLDPTKAPKNATVEDLFQAICNQKNNQPAPYWPS